MLHARTCDSSSSAVCKQAGLSLLMSRSLICFCVACVSKPACCWGFTFSHSLSRSRRTRRPVPAACVEASSSTAVRSLRIACAAISYTIAEILSSVQYGRDCQASGRQAQLPLPHARQRHTYNFDQRRRRGQSCRCDGREFCAVTFLISVTASSAFLGCNLSDSVVSKATSTLFDYWPEL